MTNNESRLYFDRRDRELLAIVDEILAQDQTRWDMKKLLAPYLHPHGIKEMAASHGLRIAYAVVRLLGSLEASGSSQRLGALKALRQEVLTTVSGDMRLNGARVLVQIMKDLIRSRGGETERLMLARDFRSAVSGRPRDVTRLLARYHLLEMPEHGNQIAFDDHVHDANTKGRKSPSHLVLDAWIKGIRSLGVVYYNHVDPAVVSELAEAAEIMGIKVRVGLEYKVRFREAVLRLVWEPKGFNDSAEYIHFFEQDHVRAFMESCREVSRCQERCVLNLIELFNRRRRKELLDEYAIRLEPISEGEFLAFVGTGRPSPEHLARFISDKIREAALEKLHAYIEEVGQEQWIGPLPDELAKLDAFDPETVAERFLRRTEPALQPNPCATENGKLPELLTMEPLALLERLEELCPSSRVILNPAGLTMPDLVLALHELKGMVTHLEIFNLKEHFLGTPHPGAEAGGLIKALNRANAIELKSILRRMIRELESAGDTVRAEEITAVLLDISAFSNLYAGRRLKTRVGSGSTGRTATVPGMGLAMLQSLPGRAAKPARAEGAGRILPVRVVSRMRVEYEPTAKSWRKGLCALLPGVRPLERKESGWKIVSIESVKEGEGNLMMLGGVSGRRGLGLADELPGSRQAGERSIPPTYLNTNLKNGLKILAGFVPAFLTFYLTKDWWLLAWFGAFIWFAITGVRNVIQSVVGGRGLGGKSLLSWSDCVSYTRVADSLLFTGFSVPLLDYLVKTLLLDRGLGVTTSTNPILLYAVMALANGLYISTHNIFRGLPKQAAFFNFFRSILSIPLAVALNAAAGGVLSMAGVQGVDAHLQKWAAIISKFASDCVAGIIEGLADRRVNVTVRLRDYAEKLSRMFEVYSRLEMLFPREDVRKMLAEPERFYKEVQELPGEYGAIVIINALDLLYFRDYQPRAATALRIVLRRLSPDERDAFWASQAVLDLEGEVSRLFVGGLLGKNFGRPLAFYLNRHDHYTKSLAWEMKRVSSTA